MIGGGGKLQEPVVRRRGECNRQAGESDASQGFDDARRRRQGIFVSKHVRLLTQPLGVVLEVRMQANEDVASTAMLIKARFLGAFLGLNGRTQSHRRHAPTIRFAERRAAAG